MYLYTFWYAYGFFPLRVYEAFQALSPRRVASCGYQTALTILVDPHIEDYYSAAIASRGVLVRI